MPLINLPKITATVAPPPPVETDAQIRVRLSLAVGVLNSEKARIQTILDCLDEVSDVFKYWQEQQNNVAHTLSVIMGEA